MPHIIIKTISGKSPEQLQQAAESAIAAVSKTLGKPGYTNPVTFE